MRRGLERMARLRTEGLSFGAAFALGFGLNHAKTKARRVIRYNGAGLVGDRKAVEADFTTASQRVAASIGDRAQ
jgi:hypothetical protein